MMDAPGLSWGRCGKAFFVEDPTDLKGALDEAMNFRGPDGRQLPQVGRPSPFRYTLPYHGKGRAITGAALSHIQLTVTGHRNRVHDADRYDQRLLVADLFPARPNA